MLALKHLVFFCSLASALVVPRAGGQDVPAGSCCFTLHEGSSNTIVKQDKSSGFLYLGGAKSDGWYCIDLSNSANILRDDFNNACFLASDGQFQCLDPTIGPNSWTLKKSNKTVYLVHDGDSSYNSCPDKAGNKLLWGQAQQGASSCKKLSLKAEGFKGSCKSFA